MSANHSKTKKKSSIGFVEEVRRSRPLYLLMLPSIIIFALFTYYPMYGIVIAFKNFTPADGIMGSSWAGLKYFKQYFNSYQFGLTIKNTIIISLYTIAVTFPLPVIMGLLVNQMKAQKFKKFFQVSTYLPHFISTVVMCGMISDFAASTGLFNVFRDLAGKPHLNFLAEPRYYRTIYIASGIWKQMGWSSILYLATLSSVDMSLYEAAAIDGAGRFRQMLSVTLPALVPIIAVQLIMRMGHIMGEGHQKTILLYNEMTWEVSDIVSSYVYRRGLKNNDYSFGAAVDLFNSLVNVIILCSANYFSKHVVKESLW